MLLLSSSCPHVIFLVVDLAGKTSLDQARADMVVDCVADMLDPIMPCYRENSEEKKVGVWENWCMYACNLY